MLAPIALYPDPLLVQMLMAATYPLEVVEAARWTNANQNMKGDQLASALEQKGWDPSVKSLVNFPNALAMMDGNLEWTQKLGDAFLAQKDQVMDTIQYLRSKAQNQGNLRTTAEQVVTYNDQAISIEPANRRSCMFLSMTLLWHMVPGGTRIIPPTIIIPRAMSWEAH